MGFFYPLDASAVIEARLRECRACEEAPPPVPCPETEPLPLPTFVFPGGWKAGASVALVVVAAAFGVGYAAGR